jgi:hypothetical protein
MSSDARFRLDREVVAVEDVEGLDIDGRLDATGATGTVTGTTRSPLTFPATGSARGISPNFRSESSLVSCVAWLFFSESDLESMHVDWAFKIAAGS